MLRGRLDNRLLMLCGTVDKTIYHKDNKSKNAKRSFSYKYEKNET